MYIGLKRQKSLSYDLGTVKCRWVMSDVVCPLSNLNYSMFMALCISKCTCIRCHARSRSLMTDRPLARCGHAHAPGSPLAIISGTKYILLKIVTSCSCANRLKINITWSCLVQHNKRAMPYMRIDSSRQSYVCLSACYTTYNWSIIRSIIPHNTQHHVWRGLPVHICRFPQCGKQRSCHGQSEERFIRPAWKSSKRGWRHIKDQSRW